MRLGGRLDFYYRILTCIFRNQNVAIGNHAWRTICRRQWVVVYAYDAIFG